MASIVHPRNPWISNGRVADLYLWSIRRRVRVVQRLMGLLLHCDIDCVVPDRLFLPHPYGIILGSPSRLGNDVTLMQQVTLGARDPWFHGADVSKEYPTIKEGAYIGAGAKILGPVTIGEWAIVGANAVITKDVPAGATVVGSNIILPSKCADT